MGRVRIHYPQMAEAATQWEKLVDREIPLTGIAGADRFLNYDVITIRLELKNVVLNSQKTYYSAGGAIIGGYRRTISDWICVTLQRGLVRYFDQAPDGDAHWYVPGASVNCMYPDEVSLDGTAASGGTIRQVIYGGKLNL